jgi:hypothetical protein
MKPKPKPGDITGCLSVKKGQNITVTTQSNKPKRLGQWETHRVRAIRLRDTDRTALEAMARRYRVKSLSDFCNGIVMELDREADPETEVIFRTYEK